jgi:diguanylate cyclase (GGDEF)-like protein/PAS domain S-box-containing protein
VEGRELGPAVGAEPEPLAKRLRSRAVDAAVLANPPVAAAFCLLRWLGLIAPLPYWLLVVIVFSGGTVAVASAALWGDHRRRWHMPLYVLVNMGVIAVVAYATGWGPVLSIGFLFGSGTAFQLFGSRVTRWAVSATVAYLGLGQLAVALGIAPTLLHQPLVHGLAGLTGLGTVLTMSLLGRVTADREKAEQEARQSEQRFKALVSNAADIIIVVDTDGMLQYVSPAFERILGISAMPYFEQSAAGFIHPVDLELVRNEMARLASDPDQVLRTQLRIRDSERRWRTFEATITNRTDDPDVRGIVGNLHDITDLLEANERFRSAFADAPVGVALVSMDGEILRTNRAFGALLGRGPEDLVGTNLREITHPDDAELGLAERRLIAAGISEGYQLEKRFLHTEGREVWVQIHASCVRDSGGRPLYLIGHVQDVTEQRQMRNRLAHAAIHDPLTGLPNRVLFLDRLSMALTRAQRQRRQVAVAFLDLDHFKLVNDGLGHAVGDELLRAVADRLTTTVRPEDTVARFGGDEFTILCEGLSHQDEALAVARRVLDALQRPFELDGSPAYVSASVGVAITDGSAAAGSVLRDSDTAMYLAKEAGRGRIEIFDGRGHAAALENLHVINELHHALAADELRLYYQPIVDLRSGAVVGVEALVRWQHPKRGMLVPDQFIRVAEECGLVVPVGAWVLAEACRQTAEWNRMAVVADRCPIEVNINISPRQLSSPDFVDTVAAAIADGGIDPAAICLEITEGMLMHDEHAAVETLHDVRRLGVRIGIDDFGTGYSSLSYLKHFPIDSLKVDRTFVDGLGEESDEGVIVGAIIALAHSLGLIAVAEGVETDAALAELQRLGCDRVQGFLLGHPQPAEALESVLFARPRLLADTTTRRAATS